MESIIRDNYKCGTIVNREFFHPDQNQQLKSDDDFQLTTWLIKK